MDLALLPEHSLKTHRSHLVPSAVTVVLTGSLGHGPSMVLVHSCGCCWNGREPAVAVGALGSGLDLSSPALAPGPAPFLLSTPLAGCIDAGAGLHSQHGLKRL